MRDNLLSGSGGALCPLDASVERVSPVQWGYTARFFQLLLTYAKLLNIK